MARRLQDQGYRAEVELQRRRIAAIDAVVNSLNEVRTAQGDLARNDDPVTYSIFDGANLVMSCDRASELVDAFKRLAAGALPDDLDRYEVVAFDARGNMTVGCSPGQAPPRGADASPSA